MIIRKQGIVKAFALFLAFSIFQLYAGGPGVYAQADPAAGAPQVSGKLSTTGNRDVLVDKIGTSTGATILDGATIETPECVSATVRFGQLEVVYLGTNTIAMIEYSNGKLKVNLKQGCANMLAGPDVDGTIVMPDGNQTYVAPPDKSHRRRAEACYPSGAKSDFNPSCINAAPVGGIKTPVIIGIVSGIVGIIALVVASSGERGENSSFSAPT
jgi:hypothetical protein